MTVCMVRRWIDQFKKGHADIHDLQRSGRPCEAITDDATESVQAVTEK